MAGVPIKQKPPDDQDHRQEVASSTVADPVSLEDGILELCSKNPEGVTNEMIVEEYPGIDAGKRLKALQRLLSSVCVCVRVCFNIRHMAFFIITVHA
jgi:hypothetical protein